MDDHRTPRAGSTHDWSSAADLGHLDLIRRDPRAFAPGGVTQLILEVVAYAADEAEVSGGGRCVVTFHPDDSISIADDGRGTAVRIAADGTVVKKPVMSTKDLRYFDSPDAQRLPDGSPRRGVSVVAALSEWLVHANRRVEGSWTQRYEHGVPVTDLVPAAAGPTTGTTVRFRPGPVLRDAGPAPVLDLAALATAWPHLIVEVCHEADGGPAHSATAAGASVAAAATGANP